MYNIRHDAEPCENVREWDLNLNHLHSGTEARPLFHRERDRVCVERI